jgi:hypothetical protein
MDTHKDVGMLTLINISTSYVYRGLGGSQRPGGLIFRFNKCLFVSFIYLYSTREENNDNIYLCCF